MPVSAAYAGANELKVPVSDEAAKTVSSSPAAGDPDASAIALAAAEGSAIALAAGDASAAALGDDAGAAAIAVHGGNGATEAAGEADWAAAGPTERAKKAIDARTNAPKDERTRCTGTPPTGQRERRTVGNLPAIVRHHCTVVYVCGGGYRRRA
jgi:hypothetical protein